MSLYWSSFSIFSEEDGQKFQQELLLLVFFCLYGVWWAILQAVQQARFTRYSVFQMNL